MRIWREEKGWYRVQTASGHAGYAAESDFTLADFEIIPEPEREDPFLPWPANGRKINLTWEAVYQVPADPSKIGPMPGVNCRQPDLVRTERRLGHDSFKGRSGLCILGAQARLSGVGAVEQRLRSRSDDGGAVHIRDKT